MAHAVADRSIEQPPALSLVPESLTDAEVEAFFASVDAAKAASEYSEPPKLIDIEEWPGRGYVERYGLVDVNGHKRSGLVGIPKHPDTDVPAIATSAWWTSGSDGHNFHSALRFLENGIPFIMVGAEGSYHPGWNPIQIPLKPVKLTSSAEALLQFAHYTTAEHHYILDQEEVTIVGESRGAMAAMGVLALSGSFGIKVGMTDITAPCFPRPFSLSDVTKFKNQLISEPRTIFGLPRKLATKVLAHYPSTIDLHPAAVLGQLLITPGLLSGEAGELGELIDGDPILHVTCFEDDYVSMPEEWKIILKTIGRDNTEVITLDGSHLTIADPETLRFIISRQKAYNLLKKQGLIGAFSQFPEASLPDDEALTGPNVFRLAHYIVDEPDLLAA